MGTNGPVTGTSAIYGRVDYMSAGVKRDVGGLRCCPYYSAGKYLIFGYLDDLVHIWGSFSATAMATTRPASSVRLTWAPATPKRSQTLRPRSEKITQGLPRWSGTKPVSRTHMPKRKPVPSALTMASLAEKCMARKRTGLRLRPNHASSSGIKVRLA